MNPPWKRTKLGAEFSQRVEKGKSDLPVMSVTMSGISSRDELGRCVASDLPAEQHLLARQGDLIYNTMRMWQGVSGIAPSDCIVSPAYVVCTATSSLNLQYAAYLLKAPFFVEKLRAYSQGLTSDRLRLYYHLFEKIPLALPPLPEQKKIAAILSSVDDAIQATQAVIDQTRQVKKGLLQELLTRGIGPDGRPHTRFKKTEIGEIPESWHLENLGSVISEPIRNGYSPVCSDEPNDRWILGLGALATDGLDLTQIKPAPPEDSRVDDYALRYGDILVSRSNTADRIGMVAVFRGEIERCSYPDLMMRTRVDGGPVRVGFLELYLRSNAARNYIKNIAAGTSGSMVKITKASLSKLPVPIPPAEEQARIEQAGTTIAGSLEPSIVLSRCLRSLKAGLLQDLLTGKVRVTP